MAKLPKPLQSLNRIVEAAKVSPIYSEKFASTFQPTSFEDIPILTKQELFTSIEKHIFDKNAPVTNRESIYVSPTGGTGADHNMGGYFMVTDLNENIQQRDMHGEFLRKYNVMNSSMIFGNLHGASSMYRSLEVTQSLIDRCNATGLPIGGGTPNDLIYTYLKRFKANSISSNPSRLINFIEYLSNQTIDKNYREELSDIKNLWYTGEILPQSKLDIVKQHFIGINNVISSYGSAEAGVWCVMNKKVFGNEYFYYDPNMMYVEILENTNEIVLTSLIKYRYPLLRYNTKDCGKIIELNENYGVLQVFGRNGISFSLNNDPYDIGINDDSNIAKYLNNQFQAFQVVLQTDETTGEDYATFKCVKHVGDSIIDSYHGMVIRQLMASQHNQHDLNINVEFCKVNNLVTSQSSGKIKPVVDLRK